MQFEHSVRWMQVSGQFDEHSIVSLSSIGGASRRFLRPGRAGFHVSRQDLHPEHAGDVRGAALPHGPAVRPHHQARDAGVEGQVERGVQGRGRVFPLPLRGERPIAPHTRRSPSWAGEGHWGCWSKLDGGGRVFRLVLCVCIFVVPPTAT